MPKIAYEIEGVDYEVGETYGVDGGDHIFRGLLSDTDVPSPGLWFDESTEEFIIIPESILSEAMRVLSEVGDDPENRGRHKKMEPAGHSEEDDVGSKSLPSGILRYRIHDEDDVMVRKLKKAINDRNITLQDVGDYNLTYGLKKRHSIKLSSLERWARVMRLKVRFDLVSVDGED